MYLPSLDSAARVVLRCYPVVSPTERLVALGNRGGFSGACLWRIGEGGSALCLRAWPPRESSAERLGAIHRLMVSARKAGLTYVPDVFATAAGPTWVEQAGRLWDLTTWLPGRADFHDQPTRARLELACTALARLHRVWAEVAPQVGPCPGVRRRLERAREWAALVKSGWRPTFAAGDADCVRPWAERAWCRLRTAADGVLKALGPWTDRPVPLQPCLCDIWHDHVLFEGHHLTGFVDFGGVKIDHVAVDLARLLGSLVADDEEQRSTGLRAYARLRPLSGEEQALVAVLDETGTLLGAANWLKWLYREGRHFEDPAAVARRLAALVERIERWG